MKTLLSTVVIGVAAAALSGCVVAPARGDYRDHRYEHRDDRYRDNGYDERRGDDRWHDGDHAGGTRTPD